MAKISVIVPVYNAEKYLSKCIDSIINQTFKDIEIILINDGSTDRSIEICKSYKEKYDNIRFISQSNKGVSAARNLGIDNAVGEYISFVDADDWITDDMYGRLYKKVKDENADLAIYNCTLEKNDETIYKETGVGLDVLERNNIINIIIPKIINPDKNNISLRGPCIYLYKRELLTKYKIYFPKGIHIGEDLIFNLNIVLNANKLVNIKEYFYHYRIYQESSNRSYNKNSLKAHESIVKNVESIINKDIININEDIYNDICIMKMKYINTMLGNECKSSNKNKLIYKVKKINDICNSFIVKDVYSNRKNINLMSFQRIILNLAFRKCSIVLYLIYKMYYVITSK